MLFLLQLAEAKHVTFPVSAVGLKNFVFFVFVKPACIEQDKVVTIPVRCMCMHVLCIRPDLSGPQLLNLCMNSIIIRHS